MTTFARKLFDTRGYAAGRPCVTMPRPATDCDRTIPISVVQAVLQRADVTARPSPRAALDLGCGPGQLARTLAESEDPSSSQPLFARVRGVDPSPGMIETARGIQSAAPVDYAIGTAEDTESWAQSGEFDLIVCVQAACVLRAFQRSLPSHWFDQSSAYPQLARILKPGGTLAYLGCVER